MILKTETHSSDFGCRLQLFSSCLVMGVNYLNSVVVDNVVPVACKRSEQKSPDIRTVVVSHASARLVCEKRGHALLSSYFASLCMQTWQAVFSIAAAIGWLKDASGNKLGDKVGGSEPADSQESQLILSPPTGLFRAA